ncbi:MAG: tetratricopeptide repeat protein [Candidatus Poribacteria bacterium]|nr:tetratricopeptide repeat protein [Candidatus Poribacteria bacterium]
MLTRNGFSELAAQMFKNAADQESLKELLTSKYSENDLVDYLQSDDPLAGRAAATALGLIGSLNVVPALVENLKNDDLRACLNTEIALWNVWSRSGNESVDKMLKAGKKALKNENFSEAVEQFTEVIQAAPNFAEGYNQRAIAYFMLEEWKNSLADCKQTIKLNPNHFGAFAGMGHVYLRLGDIGKAITAYKQALVINPNLVSIADALMQIRRAFQEE